MGPSKIAGKKVKREARKCIRFMDVTPAFELPQQSEHVNGRELLAFTRDQMDCLINKREIKGPIAVVDIDLIDRYVQQKPFHFLSSSPLLWLVYLLSVSDFNHG